MEQNMAVVLKVSRLCFFTLVSMCVLLMSLCVRVFVCAHVRVKIY